MAEKKNVIILGSTGSVGTQTVEVVHESDLGVSLLSAGKNYKLLAKQAELLKPEILSVSDRETAEKLKELTGGRYTVIYGTESLCGYIENGEYDIVCHSIAGLEGLPTAISASKSGKRIAMANKEAIISAGDIISDNIKKSGGELIPVDSEHSAIFQCLEACGKNDGKYVKNILLTASGGPFFGCRKEDLVKVTPEIALAHPTWKMGPKITVDCATLMNKGFEVIEAVRLFGVKPEQVKVLVHRQSIVHSMVEYIDNAVIAQMGAPDMRTCVRYALSYPGRFNASYSQLDFTKVSTLTFDEPDTSVFPLLKLAYDAIEEDGIMPAALIAADEVAVDAFLNRRLSFDKISDVVYDTLERVDNMAVKSTDDIYGAVTETKAVAEEIIKEKC